MIYCVVPGGPGSRAVREAHGVLRRRRQRHRHRRPPQVRAPRGPNDEPAGRPEVASSARRAIAAAHACPASSRRIDASSGAPAGVKVVVHVDGGARGNPGPAAAGAVISTPDGEVLDEAARDDRRRDEQRRRVPRPAARACERARALGASEVEVVNDSELVAKQVNGAYKVKHPDMKPLHAAALKALERLRALVDPLGPARAERRRRRARQPGARRQPRHSRDALTRAPRARRARGRDRRSRSRRSSSTSRASARRPRRSFAAPTRCRCSALLALRERRRFGPPPPRHWRHAGVAGRVLRRRPHPLAPRDRRRRRRPGDRRSPTCRSCSSRSRPGRCSASGRRRASRSPCRSCSAAPCSSPASSARAPTATTPRCGALFGVLTARRLHRLHPRPARHGPRPAPPGRAAVRGHARRDARRDRRRRAARRGRPRAELAGARLARDARADVAGARLAADRRRAAAPAGVADVDRPDRAARRLGRCWASSCSARTRRRCSSPASRSSSPASSSRRAGLPQPERLGAARRTGEDAFATHPRLMRTRIIDGRTMPFTRSARRSGMGHDAPSIGRRQHGHDRALQMTVNGRSASMPRSSRECCSCTTCATCSG